MPKRLVDAQELTEPFVFSFVVVIEQAKGITAHKNKVSVDQAYDLMRGHARRNNASMRTVAQAIVAVGLQV